MWPYAVTIGLALTGLVLLALGWRALSPARIFLARPTTPLRDVAPGPVEVAGRITARADSPVQSATGFACVAVHTLVERRAKEKYEVVSRGTVVVGALLTDATGACEVSLEHADLMGEVWERQEREGLRVTEILVRDGATVLIAGTARREARQDGSAYRSGASPLGIAGDAEAPLLVSVGGQRRALFMYGWRAVIAAVCGVLVLGVAGVTLVAHAML